MIEQTRHRVADRGVPRVADRQRSGRVRAHELDLDAPPRARHRAEPLAFLGDPSQDVVEPSLGQEDVDESGPGDLHGPDERRLREGRGDRLGDLPGRSPYATGHRECDVRREVPVLLLTGLHHVGVGEVPVQPETRRRRLEPRPEPVTEVVLDHASLPAIEARTVSISAEVSKGFVTYRTPGSIGVVSSARAVRKITGIVLVAASPRSRR